MKKISLLLVCLVVLGGGALALQAAGGPTFDLRVEGSAGTIFAGEVTAEDCVVTDGAGVEHELSGVAACGLVVAAEQSGVELAWQDFGFGLFLEGVGSDVTPADYAQSWSFWVNDELASVGVNTYTATAGDDVLLAFSPWPAVPLRVTGPATATAGETVEFLVEKRVGDYDASYVWQGAWQAAEGAILKIGGSEYSVPADGKVGATLDGPGELIVQAQGEGLVRSGRLTVEVVVIQASPSASPTASPSPSPSPSKAPFVSSALNELGDRQVQAERALNYLREQQQADGTIDGYLTSAWSTLAFGADGVSARYVVQGGASLWDGMWQVSLSSATDVERHIMAVRATGGDPRTAGGRNLVQELKSYYVAGQLGEETLINDDVFGVLALTAAAEPVGGLELTEVIKTVLAAQQEDGSWGDIDMTAAAVQGLKAYADRGGSIEVANALARAREYLRDRQDKYGGWGQNSATTAWTIQAVVALGERVEAWQNAEGLTPWQALARYQNSNGGFGWRSDKDVSAFMTAYAVPALLEKPWPITQVALAAASVVAQPEVKGVVMVSKEVEPTRQPVYTPTPVPIFKKEEIGKVIGPNETDRNFALTVFGLANLGIGLAAARLFLI